MIKLLWIDDNLDHDLTEKRMALYMEDDLDPHFARDATEAYHRLVSEPFDVVIFDLRMPSGPDNMWNEHRDQGVRKYGYILLEMVALGRSNTFEHLKNARLGVFTIEAREENEALFQLPIGLPDSNFMMKTHAFHEGAFLRFIRSLKPC